MTPLHKSLQKRGLDSTAYRNYELSEYNKKETLRKSHGRLGTLNNSLVEGAKPIDRKSCINPFLSKSFNGTIATPTPNSTVGMITKNTSFGLLGIDGPDDLNNSNIFERAEDVKDPNATF